MLRNKNQITAIVLFIVMFFFTNVSAQGFKFDFGDGPVAPGYIGIKVNTKFSTATGYGIDGGNVSSVTRNGPDALTRDYLTTTGEFFFSVAVPQGNYTVKITFGDLEAASATTVKAENRRLIFDRVTTASGTVVSQSATVRRMETKSIDGSVTMSIKDRELEYYTWDKLLTLRISGSKPAVAAIEITKNDAATTLFLCGNSTVVDQMASPWSSWGQMIPNFFDSTVAIANYAESGLTSGNFLSMKRLSKLLTEVKPGDYVFVEFGHNDQKNSGDVTAYPSNLKSFSDQIKKKGAIPVFVTPTARQGDNDALTSIGGLAQTMRKTANSLGVIYIDLNQMVIDLQKALGADAKFLYMHTAGDKTHFCEYGGYELARSVLKELQSKVPALKNKFKSNYTPFDPTKPDPLNVLEIALPPLSNPDPNYLDPMCGVVSCDVVLEAENFCLADGVVESMNAGFLGLGYLNVNNAIGSKATYMLETNKAISRTMYIRYANGTNDSRKMSLSASAYIINEIEFPPTGGWTNWSTVPFNIELFSGKSLLELRSLNTDGGPNIDWIGWTGTEIKIVKTCETPPSSIKWLKGLTEEAYSLNVRNAFGSLIKTWHGKGKIDFSRTCLPQGVYYVDVLQGDKALKTLKIIQK